MSEYQFRHDRAGYTGQLRVHIESTGSYGAPGVNGLGQGAGFDDGIINLAGLLKMPDGSAYNAAGTPPGGGFIPAEHRLTVYRGATPISSLTFAPIETAAGVVDINTLLSQGKAVAATPAQLLSLAAVAAELALQNDTYGQTLTAIQLALADIEQSTDALAAIANAVPYANLAALTANGSASKPAIALDTGAVYARGGASPGPAIGYVSTPATINRQRGVTAESQGVLPGMAAADVSAALAAGQAAMKAANQSVLYLGAYVHNLSEPLVLDGFQNHLRGHSGSDWVGSTVIPSGTVLKAANTVTDLVILAGKANAGGTYTASASSVEGITFYGTPNADGTRSQNGFHSTQGNGPGRPNALSHDTFRGLFAGIRSTVPAGQSTGMFNVKLGNVVMRENDYGIYGTGTGSFGNLDTTGAVIEQNFKGGIFITGLFGSNIFGGALYEGQPNPIIAEGGLVHNRLTSAYFEANTGKIRFSASNSNSTHTIDPQYVFNCPELYGELSGGRMYVRDKALIWRVTGPLARLRVFEGDRLGVAPTATPTMVNITANPQIFRNRAAPPLGFSLVENTAGTVLDTPTGRQLCVTLTDANGGYLNPGLTTQAGEALIAVAPARRLNADTAASAGAGWFDSSFVNFAAATQVYPLDSGEWGVPISILTGAPAGTQPRFRWHGDAGGVVFGGTTFYRATLPLTTASLTALAQAAVPLFMAPPSALAAASMAAVQFPPAGLPAAYGRWPVSTPGRYAPLPSGQRRVLTIAANGNTTSNYLALTGVSQTAAQRVRVAFWARCPDGATSTLTPNTLNQSNVALAGGVIRATVTGSEWATYTMDIPVDVANAANAPATLVKLRISTAGSAVEISDVAAYSYDPAVLTNPPAWVPRTSEVVIPGTLLSGQTSVVIPHGLQFAPGFATAAAQGNTAVWVSAIDATNITVTAAVGPGADVPVVVRVGG